ncbi:hypothetical protein ILYODFUR_002864 [Ilyodon furcidens]|uniref:Uncharacterized protein n=1 Tax=Ilyodon furcidens TaxID=33524 RepID=A0ABV0T4T3_9TELE
MQRDPKPGFKPSTFLLQGSSATNSTTMQPTNHFPSFVTRAVLKCLQQLPMILFYHFRRMSAHSSLQNCFSSAPLKSFQARIDCLRLYHCILARFKSRHSSGHSNTFIFGF